MSLVEELGLVNPDLVLPRGRPAVDYSREAVKQRKATRVAQQHGPPIASEVDPFATWPDGRILGMFDAEPAGVQWFAENALLAGRGHVCVGVGGTSKTRMQYHLGVAAITGRLPWNWKIKQTGSAALFLTEDTGSDVHRAIHSLGRDLSREERLLVEEKLRVFPMAGHPMRLLALSGSSIFETDAYDWVMRELALMPKPLAYIGIDPALGVTEGNELEQAHQRRLGELIDRIAIDSGACVVLTAHAPKALLQAEELGSHAARGGGALTDAVRGEFVVRNMTADEAKRFGIEDRAERQSYLQLAATKGNHLPPEAYTPLWLRRGLGGSLSQVTLEQVERGSVGPREMKALDLLKRTAPQGDTTLRFWRADCVAAGLIPKTATDSAQEKSMQRIRDALRDAGLVAPGSFKGSWVPT